MKRLLLIRHAKAVHEHGFSDFERPLKRSGLADAELMAGRLKSLELAPQVIISSPALRAKATANIFSELLSLPEPRSDKNIYDADLKTLLQVINELPDKYHFIALTGHNPGINQLLFYLTGEIKDVATCAVMVIDFEDKNWKTVSSDMGVLAYYDEP